MRVGAVVVMDMVTRCIPSSSSSSSSSTSASSAGRRGTRVIQKGPCAYYTNISPIQVTQETKRIDFENTKYDIFEKAPTAHPVARPTAVCDALARRRRRAHSTRDARFARRRCKQFNLVDRRREHRAQTIARVPNGSTIASVRNAQTDARRVRRE